MEGIKNEVIEESFDLARFGTYYAIHSSILCKNLTNICGVNLFT